MNGFAVFTECSASGDRHTAKRLQLFVAADIPNVSQHGAAPRGLTPAAEEQRHWLEAQGYSCWVSSGGVRLDAEPTLLSHVSKHLQQVAQLAPLLHHATLLARAMGGVPVQAIP